MPFYIRKSISFGPLRFNISKSGLGVSAGIHGLRVGSGAHGNYIHAGRYGVYYRKSLPGEPIETARMFRATKAKDPAAEQSTNTVPAITAGDRISEFESGYALSMRDTSAQELLDELNQRRNHKHAWQIYAVASAAILVAFILGRANTSTLIPLAIVGTVITYWAYQRDKTSRTVVYMYDLDPESEERVKHIHTAFDGLQGSDVWHVQTDSQLPTSRSAIRPIIASGPAVLQTNVSVPEIPVGKQILYFLPERVLVEAPEGFGTVKYSELKITVTNNSGFERIHFTSASGLNELIEVSRPGFGEELKQALARAG